MCLVHNVAQQIKWEHRVAFGMKLTSCLPDLHVRIYRLYASLEDCALGTDSAVTVCNCGCMTFATCL
jgi:hypothetical protein